MKKLVLAYPCYGPYTPELDKMLRVATMHASSTGAVQWLGDVSSIRQGWVAGRNSAAKAAVDSGAEGVYWQDDDVMLPSPEVIARLINYEQDFVTGIVFQKAPPYYPLVAIYDDGMDKGKGMRFLKKIPERVLLPIQGCGFGCVYTSTALLKKISELPDFKQDGWFNQIPSDGYSHLTQGSPEGRVQTSNGFFSEDFSFCLRAMAAGVQLYADTAIMCGHLDGINGLITQKNFLDWQAKLEAEKEGTPVVPEAPVQSFDFAK